MKRVLVMRSGAVGDFILTLPVLTALRELWPAAEIEILGHPHVAGLAVEAGLADRLSRIDDPFWLGLFAKQDTLPPHLVEAIAPRDLVVCFTPDADHAMEQRLRHACRGQVIMHPPLPPEGDVRVHATAHLLAALTPLGAQPRPQPARLSLSADRRRQGVEYLKERGLSLDRTPIVAIHPGSGSRKKCWSWEGFVGLARSLGEPHEGRGLSSVDCPLAGHADGDSPQRTVPASRAPKPAVTPGCSILFTFGPADEHLQEHVQSLGAPTSTFISDLDLTELASVLCHAQCYVGNDSGVTHLAAALGVPTVAVFGPTDPRVWAPVGSHVEVVQGRCPRGPCSREARSECPEQVCLSEITVESVRACMLRALAAEHLT